MATRPAGAGAARPGPARRRRLRHRPPAARALALRAGHRDRPRRCGRQGGRAWRSAPTTTSPSPSTCANCWPASRPCCAALPPAAPPARRGRHAPPTQTRCASPAGSSTPRRAALIDPQGDEVALTTGEFDLLCAFARHPGRVLSRDFLLEQTRGREAAPFDRTIDVQVGRLRKKLEGDAGGPADHQVGARRRLHLRRRR